MKCKHVQKTLVATSGRRTLSEEVRAHLGDCSNCRHWHTRLQELDLAVTRLPVPSAPSAKSAFVQKFLAVTVTPARRWHERLPGTWWQKASVAIAASVLLILVWSGVLTRERLPDRTPAASSDPLLAAVLQRHSELATAPSSVQRLRTLTSLSEDLDGETRNLARVANATELAVLADLYEAVVTQGVYAQADEVPPDDRPKLLTEVADRFFRTSQTADQWVQEVPPAAADSLRRIARTARAANTFLRTKARTDVALQDPEPVRQLPAGG